MSQLQDSLGVASEELAWQAVVRELWPFVSRRVASRADAEDILQDVLLRAHRGLAGLDEQTRVRAWLHSIARNAISDFHRRQGRKRVVPLTPSHLEGTPLEPIEQEESGLTGVIAPHLHHFIERLPPVYRQTLTLTDIEGRTQADAARTLCVGLSAIKSRVQRGRARLRRLLEDCCHLGLDARGRIVECRSRSSACPVP